MKVNENISYETLRGLISRATDNEKLWIADEWLRENKVVTIKQYRSLREFWNVMFRKYGTWKIIIQSGSVKYDYAIGTYRQMLQVCKASHWHHNHNNGLVWDMEITEA